MGWPTLATLGCAAIGLSACLYDPGARLAEADLHVTVTHLHAEAEALTVRAILVGPEGTTFTRTVTPDRGLDLDLYLPTLPSGRYQLVARSGPTGTTASEARCARLDREIDAAASPQDVTLDMLSDAVPCEPLAADELPDDGVETESDAGTPDRGTDTHSPPGRPPGQDRDARVSDESDDDKEKED